MNQLNQFDSLAEKEKDLWREKYHTYLDGPEWQVIRVRKIRNANHRCESCSAGAKSCLQLHHLTYERVFNEHDEDLIVLCRRCHQRAEDAIKARQLYRRGNVQYLRVSTLNLLQGERLDTKPSKPYPGNPPRLTKSQRRKAKKQAKKVAQEKFQEKIAARKEKRAKRISKLPMSAFSNDQINTLKSGNNGWTRESLAKLGVSWPPPKGWRKALIKNYETQNAANDYCI